MREFVTFTREQLYDLVWQKPVHRIVLEYAISDVGLAKICRRHGIPKPGRGYWAKPESSRPPRVPLPRSKNSPQIRIPSTPSDHVTEAREAAVATEKQGLERIIVGERLQRLCPLVQEARSALQGASTNAVGFVERPSECLDLQVSPGQLSRALRIADALIKFFQKQGWETVNRDGRTLVELDGVHIGVTIEEGVTLEHAPPKTDLKSSYAFHYNRFGTVRKPSGRLSIKILEDYRLRDAAPQRRNWNDSDKKTVEDRLNDVIVGMQRLVATVKSDQRRREDEARAMAEQKRLRAAALEEQGRQRKAFAAEKKRVESLLEQAERWRESQSLRLFVAHARKTGKIHEMGLEGDELDTWSKWALQQADRLDPFEVSPPSILDEAERIEHMCDQWLRGRW